MLYTDFSAEASSYVETGETGGKQIDWKQTGHANTYVWYVYGGIFAFAFFGGLLIFSNPLYGSGRVKQLRAFGILVCLLIAVAGFIVGLFYIQTGGFTLTIIVIVAIVISAIVGSFLRKKNQLVHP